MTQLPKPELLIRHIFSGGNVVEARTTRYDEKEIKTICNNTEPYEFYAVDEHDLPILITIDRPMDVQCHMIMDFASIRKSAQTKAGMSPQRTKAGLVVP